MISKKPFYLNTLKLTVGFSITEDILECLESNKGRVFMLYFV